MQDVSSTVDFGLAGTNPCRMCHVDWFSVASPRRMFHVDCLTWTSRLSRNNPGTRLVVPAIQMPSDLLAAS